MRCSDTTSCVYVFCICNVLFYVPCCCMAAFILWQSSVVLDITPTKSLPVSTRSVSQFGVLVVPHCCSVDVSDYVSSRTCDTVDLQTLQ